MATTTPRTIINLKPASRLPRPRYLIFFITGNPGLIDFYAPFLTQLHHSLQQRVPHASFEVFGRSLSGFELGLASSHGYPASASRTGERTPPFGLQAQIEGVEWTLWDHVRGMVEEAGGEGEEEPRVVLVGHSVGAYIALEVCRRWREGMKGGVDEKEEDRPGRIVGCVNLFPGIVDIAKSSKGRVFSILLAIPHFPLLANLVVRLLTFWIPITWGTALVRLLSANSPGPAATTAAWIKSSQGLRRALHLAADELDKIKHDSWDAEIWGAAAASPLPLPRPRLYFLFARRDEWVADETREALMEGRGRARGRGRGGKGAGAGAGRVEGKVEGNEGNEGKEGNEDEDEDENESWKPVMEIDGNGVVHGFCLDDRQTTVVADRVREYVEEIVEAGGRVG